MAMLRERERRLEPDEIARIIRTPLSLAEHCGKAIIGRKFDPAKHLQLFEREILPALVDEENQSFLMLNCPPRHGKTIFVLFVAAWFLMMYPTKRVIYVSYNDDLSAVGGQIVKTIVERYGPKLFDVRVSRTTAKSDWQLDVSYDEDEDANILAGMLSVGVGSTITGRGGDLIIVDDLIKNAEEAASKATKAKHVREYDGTIRSRLEPGGTMIVIATRWAEDDLPGTLQERFEAYKDKPEDEQGDPWTFIELPALAELSDKDMEDLAAMYDADGLEVAVENWRDQLGRKEGEALWPQRYKAKDLVKIRNSIDEFSWRALYQQRPTERKGGMFPKSAWNYYPCEFGRNDEEHCIIARHDLTVNARCWAWDTAFTEDDGDWTVGELWGLTDEEEMVILEFHRVQKAGAGVDELVKDCAYRTGTSVAILVEQERAGSGKYVVQAWQKNLPGFVVEGRRPEGTKEERATPWSSFVQSGRARLPEGAKFIRSFHHEHTVFPRGRHDDQVDPGVYAYQYLLANAGVSSWSPLDAMTGGNVEEELEMLAWLAQAGVHSNRYLGGN